MTARLPVLLFEPQAVMRQTVALTSRSIGIGPIHQAATLMVATRMARQQPFAAAIVSLDADDSDSNRGQAMDLISLLRSGDTPSPKNLHVLVTAAACDRTALQALHGLGVHKILLKPFKARQLIDAVRDIADTAQLSALAESRVQTPA